MSRELFYFMDYATTARHRRRIVVMPPDDSVLRPEDVPPWGGDSSGNFFRLADGAFTIPTPSTPQAKFENFIIGMASTPIYELTINYHKLHRNHLGTPSTESQELAAGLRSYTLANGGSYGYGAASTRNFNTAPVIWIYSDEGDSTLGIADFTCRFRGTIRASSKKKGKLTTGVGFSQTVELYDLGRAVLDTILMSDVCASAIESGYTNDTEYPQTVDTPWTCTDSTKLRTQHGGIEVLTGPQVRMYPLALVFLALQTIATTALWGWLRRDIDDVGDSYVLLSSNANGTGATCWDHWTRYNQTQTPTMTRGTALNRGDWNIIGEVMSAPIASAGARIGGVLHPGTDDVTLARTGYSAWDFLTECCKAGLCKGKLLMPSDIRMTVRFNRPLESQTVRTLARTDMIRKDINKPMETEPEEGFEVVGQVEVAVDGAEGDEPSSINVRNFGSANEEGGASRTMFSTEPSVGASDDWLRAVSGGDMIAYNPNAFPLRHLFYFGAVPGITGDVPIRIHHNATIDLGNGVTWNETTAPVLPDGGADAAGFAAWRDTIRVTLSSVYYTSATAYTMCRLLTTLFGDAKIAMYPLTIWGNLAGPEDIGDEYRLGPADGGGNYTAAALDAGEADVSDLYGRCYLLSTKINEDQNTAEVELVGMSF